MSWYQDGVPEVFEVTRNGTCRCCGHYQAGTCDKTGICYDCWWNIRDGVLAERARTIDILRQQKCNSEDDEQCYGINKEHCETITAYIALIEEEKK